MAAVRRSLSGVAFTPRPDPPRFSLSPWNSFKLVMLSDGTSGLEAQYTVEKISSYLCSHYGLHTILSGTTMNLDIALRFRSIRVFSREDYSPLLVFVHSIIGEDDLAILEDIPSKMLRARVGYRWPKSFSDVVFHKSPRSLRQIGAWDDVIFTIKMHSASATYAIYLDLLWRPDLVDIVQAKTEQMFPSVKSPGPSEYSTCDM